MRHTGITAAATLMMMLIGFGTLAHGSSQVPNPHASFNHPGSCVACHEVDDRTGGPPEHLRADDVEKLCAGCHSKSSIGISHPVAVRPETVFPDMTVPETLPLDDDGLITCVTCHNPHRPYFSGERFFPKQDPLFCTLETLLLEAGEGHELRAEPALVAARATGEEILLEQGCYYQTFFLRVHEADAGNHPLCKACHATY